jgi:hypothetical protein
MDRRHYSLAHQASARLNTLAAKAPPCLSLKARRGAKALAGHRISAPRGPDNRLRRFWSRPWNKLVTWDRTPLGLETATPCQPRAALAVEGSEKRWNLRDLESSGAAPGG